MSPGWRACAVGGVMVLLVGTLPGAGAPVPKGNDTSENPPRRVDKYGDPLPPYAAARLGTVRLRHGGPVNGLAFSPDGKTLASAGDDGRVLLWDVATGKELREMSHPYPVGSVLFSSGGKLLVSAAKDAEDPRIQVRDVRSGEVVRSLELPSSGGFVHMATHPDGKTLFAGSGGGLVYAWELASGRELWHCGQDREGWCKCLALSADGKMLAAGGTSRDVELRDAATGKLTKRLATGAVNVLGVAFAPDGRTLALAGHNGELEFWDLVREKLACQRRLSHSGGVPIVFAPDGKRLACGSLVSVVFFDPARGNEVARLQTGDSGVLGVAFSPDGRYFAAAGDDHTLRVWDAATLKPLHAFACEPGGKYSASFRLKGRLVARTAGGVSERNVPFRGRGCLSPDGKVFAGEGAAGRVHLVDASSGKSLRTVGKESEYFSARAADFSPDGSVVAVVTNELGAAVTFRGQLDRLRLWDVATGKLVATPIDGKELNTVLNVRFSSRGGLLVADQRFVNAGPLIHLWHYRKGQPLRRLGVPELRGEFEPAVSEDGWLLITRLNAKVDEDLKRWTRTIRVREVVSGKEILSLEDQPAFCRVALSPDNRLLAVSDATDSIRLVDVASGKELRRLRGHRGEIASLEFSPDGDFLVSGSADTTALVWDVRACLPEKTADTAKRPNETLWDDLASGGAAAAFRAMQTLTGDPEGGVALLKRRLRPVSPPEARAVRALIADLDNDQFNVRERAEGSLRDLDRSVAPLLQEALKTPRSVETRRRLERLLAEAEDPRNSPQRLRDLRAVHCLTAIGTAPARQLLQTLAEGAPEALLTQQAREELEWLARR